MIIHVRTYLGRIDTAPRMENAHMLVGVDGGMNTQAEKNRTTTIYHTFTHEAN